MRALSWAVTCLMVLGVGSAAAQAQQHRPDPQAGRELALHTCDACHVVAPGQLAPIVPGYGPAFAEIANRPTTSATSLQGFLTAYHPRGNMPYPTLSTAQAGDLAAFILSMRKQR